MNIKQADKKIEKLELVIRAEEKRETRLGIIKHELDLYYKDHTLSHKRLQKEKLDVEVLEERSLTSLFAEILGNKEEQLQKERQEYLQEVLHHNALVDEIEILKYEEKILKEKSIGNVMPVKKQLQLLLDSKEKLLSEDPKHKSELRKYNSRMRSLVFKMRDIEEAIAEGKALELKFTSILNNIKNVKKWGAYRMHGKGRYSSYNKKSFIDKANKDAIMINVQIKKFGKELSDIHPDINVNMSMKYYENFVDHFYDNLITDWIIQKKISTAFNSMSQMMDKLKRILLMLNKELADFHHTQKEINDEKLNFIKKIA